MAESRSRSRKADESDEEARAEESPRAAESKEESDDEREHRRRMVGMDPEKDVVPIADGEDHGYIGQVPDVTPNEAYTLRGVTSSDAAARADRLAARRRNTAY